MITWLCTNLVDILTNTSYAQRILLNRGIFDYVCLFWRESPPVDDKIHDPRIIMQLEMVCQDVLNKKTFDELSKGTRNVEDIVNLLMLNYSISGVYKNLVEIVVNEIQRCDTNVKLFNDIALVVVDGEEHKKLLDELWIVIEDRPLPESYDISHTVKVDDKITSSWGLLGFQRPLTDFRKTGLLGLQCLHYLVTKFTEKSKKVLRILSVIDQLWFPFALTSINVTSWTLEYWNECKLSAFSYVNSMEPLEIFYIIHCFIFFRFIKCWLGSNPDSILDFSRISGEFRAMIIEDIEYTISSFNPATDKLLTTALLNKIDGIAY